MAIDNRVKKDLLIIYIVKYEVVHSTLDVESVYHYFNL